MAIKRELNSKKREALVEAYVEGKDKTQVQLGKEVGLTPVSVSRALSNDKVIDAISQEKDKKQKIGRLSYKAAQQATYILKQRVDQAVDKIDSGETLDDIEISKILELQQKLLNASIKVKEAGLEVEEDSSITPAEANEIAQETIQLCRYYAELGRDQRKAVEGLVTKQLTATGGIDIEEIVEFLSTDVGHLAHPTIDVEPIEPIEVIEEDNNDL